MYIRRPSVASLTVECPSFSWVGQSARRMAQEPLTASSMVQQTQVSHYVNFTLLTGENTLLTHPFFFSVILEPCHLLEGEMGRKEDSQERINGSTMLGNQCPSLTLQAATSLVQMKQLWQYFLTKVEPTTTNKNNTTNPPWELQNTLILFLVHPFPNVGCV